MGRVRLEHFLKSKAKLHVNRLVLRARINLFIAKLFCTPTTPTQKKKPTSKFQTRNKYVTY